MDILSVLLTIKQKSDIPHPEDTIHIHPFVLDNEHPLVIVKLTVFLQDELKIFFSYFNLLSFGSKTLKSWAEPLNIILFVDNNYLILLIFDLFSIKIQQFINKCILSLFLIPTISFSAQFFLNQPNKEPMKLFFLRFFQEFSLESSK